MAYIPITNLNKYIISQFEEGLRKGLDDYASRNHMFQDERYAQAMKSLTNIVTLFRAVYD